MPGGDAYIRKYQSVHSKRQKKQKQNEEAKRNQGSLLGFLKPRDNDHPSSSGHEEDDMSTSVSARDDIQDPVAEVTESLTPFFSSDNDPIASAEDDDPPTTVCGREEPLEGCQLTDLWNAYSDDPADWKITQELIDHFTRNPPSQNLDKDLHTSARSYTSKTKYVQWKFFVRKLANEGLVGVFSINWKCLLVCM